MSIAVCPGSFDPITLGHVDVVERAASMFDSVIVAVAHNAQKKYLFSDDERLELVRSAVGHLDNVSVEFVPGLLARFATEAGAVAIVKGLRGAADFDDEQAMALLNRHLSGIETVFIMGDPTLAHISSSYVKDIVRHRGRFNDLVSPDVATALSRALAESRPPSTS